MTKAAGADYGLAGWISWISCNSPAEHSRLRCRCLSTPAPRDRAVAGPCAPAPALHCCPLRVARRPCGRSFAHRASLIAMAVLAAPSRPDVTRSRLPCRVHHPTSHSLFRRCGARRRIHRREHVPTAKLGKWIRSAPAALKAPPNTMRPFPAHRACPSAKACSAITHRRRRSAR